MGVEEGTVVDGECVDAEADKTFTEEVLAQVDEHEEAVEAVNNFVAGFADTITFTLTEQIRKKQGTDETVDPCSASYIGGQVTGVVWSVAAGGEIANAAGGVNSAAAELGNITVGTAQYESTLAGLNAAEKLAALGGTRAAVWQAMKNIANPGMWSTYAKTTFTTGPTLGAGAGLVTGAATGAVAGHNTAENCF
jgi:hypothetical protein